MNPPPLLHLRGVTKRFGDAVAVHALDLEVAPGEYFCILGPSGSGKSTLLRMVAGFVAPDAGEIHLAGGRLDTLPPERRELHTVFQGYALFPHLSVFENVAFGLRIRGMRGDGVAGPVGEALALVGLRGFDARTPASLSGGEQQRVALARALVNRPRLLLLDEPLSALDRKLRLRMQGELARIQRETGITFVHVTHDQEEALRLADRLGVMHRGELLRVGTPDEVYRRPGSAFVADFLGSANLLRLRAAAGGLLLPDGTGIALPEGFPLPHDGQERWFAVRPEALRFEAESVDRADRAGRTGSNGAFPVGRIPGVVAARRRIGAVEELIVDAGSMRWTVHAHGSLESPLPTPGAPITLLLDPRELIPLDDPTAGGPAR